MGNINIQYKFNLNAEKCETFVLCLDEESMEPVEQRTDLPEWTQLESHQCSHCPLDSQTHKNCPVAVNLVDVIESFENVVSHDEVDLEVTTSERHVCAHTTAQRGISSLFGLLMATSGCPYTDFLKPMARFHLPLASEQETIFRASGMYLLAQYFMGEQAESGEEDFAGLTKIYEDLHILNTTLAQRLRSATQTDSSINAVILLDMFTNLMPYVIEDHLDEIKYLFNAYLK